MIWNKRQISLAGKIAILKSLVCSKLTYCQTALASPSKDIWKDIETTLYAFINNDSTDKMKRNTLIGQPEDGGFKMIDVRSQNKASKIRWMNRLITNQGIWSDYVLKKIRMEPLQLLRCNIKYKDLPFNFEKGSMWDEIWDNWCEINYEENVNTAEKVLNQQLWYNSHIKIGKRVAWYQKWSRGGINWISDIIATRRSIIRRPTDFSSSA